MNQIKSGIHILVPLFTNFTLEIIYIFIISKRHAMMRLKHISSRFSSLQQVFAALHRTQTRSSDEKAF